MTPPAESAAAMIRPAPVRRDSKVNRWLLRMIASADARPGREVSRPRVSAGPR